MHAPQRPGRVVGEQVLPSNVVVAPEPREMRVEWGGGAWEEPDALGDVACVAGLLGLAAGLLAVLRLSAGHFPDTLFWRALPLLLVLPPACFLGTLLAPGGLLDGHCPTAWSRAAKLGLGGLVGYLAPLAALALAASLGSIR